MKKSTTIIITIKCTYIQIKDNNNDRKCSIDKLSNYEDCLSRIASFIYEVAFKIIVDMCTSIIHILGYYLNLSYQIGAGFFFVYQN